VIIVAIVQVIQIIGDRLAQRVDHRTAATAGAGRSRRVRRQAAANDVVGV
jgi:D-methionine transport system permease protein